MISGKAGRPIQGTANRNVLSNYNVEDLTGADFESDYRIEEALGKTAETCYLTNSRDYLTCAIASFRLIMIFRFGS